MPTRASTRRRNRRPELNKLKDVPCADCTGRFPPDEMCFIHARPPVLFAISQHQNHGWDAVLAEVAKCDVVCRPCCTWRVTVRNQLLASMREGSNIKIDPKGDPVRQRVVLQEGIRLNRFAEYAASHRVLDS